MADLTRIQDHVWKSLSFRQRLAGRAFVNRIVARAVKRWPDNPEESSIAGVASDVEKEEVGMGVILMFVVGALVNQIVRIIFDWWKNNRGAFDA
jgi:hypothetical protein